MPTAALPFATTNVDPPTLKALPATETVPVTVNWPLILESPFTSSGYAGEPVPIPSLAVPETPYGEAGGVKAAVQRAIPLDTLISSM